MFVFHYDLINNLLHYDLINKLRCRVFTFCSGFEALKNKMFKMKIG